MQDSPYKERGVASLKRNGAIHSELAAGIHTSTSSCVLSEAVHIIPTSRQGVSVWVCPHTCNHNQSCLRVCYMCNHIFYSQTLETTGHTDSHTEEEDLSGDSMTTLPHCTQLNEDRCSRSTPKRIMSRRKRAASSDQSSRRVMIRPKRQVTNRPQRPTSRQTSPCMTSQSGLAALSPSRTHVFLKHTTVSTPSEDQKTKTKLMKVSKTGDSIKIGREKTKVILSALV